jgi:bifunctional non-homologous end joining protein LigD
VATSTRARRGSLRDYWRKRDFGKTAEPRGKAAARRARKLQYVIQKHDATRLHFDLRLELDGVMKSWAVPKGPSRDPTVRRLAMHVEDHPMEYNKFEGVIPEGEYGAGEVIIWDRGSYTPEGGDVDAFVAASQRERCRSRCTASDCRASGPSCAFSEAMTGGSGSC